MKRFGAVASVLTVTVLTLLASADARPGQVAGAGTASRALTDCACYDVSVVDVRGNRRTTLFSNVTRGWNLFDLSPNHRRIVFTHDPKLYVASITGSGVRTLFDAYIHFAVWSPDGTKIAFGPDEPHSCSGDSLWVVNADGSDAHHVADCALGVAWSPDSRELAFASYAGPDVRTGRVAVVNADGSGFRVLSTPANEIWRITWSPRGNWIAYSLFRPHNTVHVVRADGVEEDTVATGWFGSWSPDGNRIVYTRTGRLNDKGAPINTIRMMNRDGKRGRVLVRGPVDGATWSPNGRWVAYVRGVQQGCGCRVALDAIRPHGTGQHRLVTFPRNTDVGPIYWSRDSARILYLHAVALGE